MALKSNMILSEMVGFIDNELLPQIKSEIQALIYPTKVQGGYFVVTRQIMCMVDFMGALYTGYHLNDRRQDKYGQKIASTKKAKQFILTFFEPKNTYQKKSINYLYEMYRHGLIHLYQPKVIKLDRRKVLKWFFYKGRRHQNKIVVNTDRGSIEFKNVDHLVTMSVDPDKKNFYLPICINSLCDDFIQAVLKYRKKLRFLKYQRNWRTTVNAICKARYITPF